MFTMLGTGTACVVITAFVIAKIVNDLWGNGE